jgi:3-oxoacyl-[acyl-carrier protein] reductase
MNTNVYKNKNVLITGASGGLGKELALSFLNKGSNLLLTSTNQEKLTTLKNELKANKKDSQQIFCKTCNLESPEEIYNLSKYARQHIKNIDILVNVAGIFLVSDFIENTIDDFDKSFSVNVRAPFLLSQALVPQMIKNKFGKIINIASSSAYGGHKQTAIYCASKHALLGLSRSLYDELKDQNVRVYCISPGSIKTPMGKLIKNQVFDSFIDAKELAEYILFNCSFENQMINQELRLNRFKPEFI